MRNNRMPSFAGDLAAMISAVELGVKLHGELIAKNGADVVRAAINWNIAETERRFRAEVARWPAGEYPADVWIDQDTAGNPDVRVHVTCRVAGDQLTVDMTGSDARPELVCVWNTFSNTRGYAMAQLASMVDPTIPKNEGLFDAVEMIVPEGSILQPPPGKPVGARRLPSRRSRSARRSASRSRRSCRNAPRRRSTSSACRTRWSASTSAGRCGWTRAWTCAPPTPPPRGRRWLGRHVQRARQPDPRDRRGGGDRFPVLNLSRELTPTRGRGPWRGSPARGT